MAGEHNSSGSGGSGPEPQSSSDTSQGTEGCPYHTEAKSDCLYCREHTAYESVRRDWVDRCPHCKSFDIRHNVGLLTNFAWCGACGKRDGQ